MNEAMTLVLAAGEASAFVRDLSVILITALAVAILFHRLKLPAVLGYLLAGMLLGPYMAEMMPSWLQISVTDRDSINTLAELGVIFLLLCLGLEFSLKDLFRVGLPALMASTAKALLTSFAAFHVGKLLGFTWQASLFLAAMLSISSTVICTRLLKESGNERSGFAPMVIGMLVGQDILAVIIIAMLSGLAQSDALDINGSLAQLAQMMGYMALLTTAGLMLLPPLIRSICKRNNHEMNLLATLATGLGVALLTANIGLGAALGAFLAGAVIAETEFREQLLKLTEPIKDMFLAVYFVSTGMIIDPQLLIDNFFLIGVISLLAIVLKYSTACSGSFLTGRSLKESLMCAAVLVPIGEFSFIIADLGRSMGLIDNRLHALAVGVAVNTTIAAPLLLKASDKLGDRLSQTSPRGLLKYAFLYQRWLQRRKESYSPIIRKTLRRSLLMLLFNMAMVIGIFLFAAAGRDLLAKLLPGEKMPFYNSINWNNSLPWGIAALLSTPILIAISRKLLATCMIVAELSSIGPAKNTPESVKKLVNRTLFCSGMFLMLITLALLSSLLQPDWLFVFTLLAALTLLSALLWKQMIRFYARVEVLIREMIDSTEQKEINKTPGTVDK